MPHTLIFDIGKTNKKCFLLDAKYQEVWKEYVRFEEIKDADGFPCDDLVAITNWVKKTAKKLLKSKGFDIQYLNFSTYGASFVHIDKDGQALCPLYNYLKPYPTKVLKAFHKKYGGELAIAQATASPPSGMLNSGLQLYWLKQANPKVYNKIQYSLHFPQYLSYLFTGIPLSDFTSIGCHTSLWDYEQKKYHQWVYEEGIHKKLAPIVATNTSINTQIAGKQVTVGVGIHDSSAALLPYLSATQNPFLLLSTGTWSIALNPFSKRLLTKKDLKSDCLNYLQIDGQPVRASRLFLGNEYKVQIKKLAQYYKIDRDLIKQIKFNPNIYKSLSKQTKNYFTLASINSKRKQPQKTDLKYFDNYEIAYHQLMIELVKEQISFAERAIQKTKIKKIYIDGGFADNDLFIKLLLLHFKDYKIQTTQAPLGSALGAAIVVQNKKVKSNFLKKQYAMKKQQL
ncbi:MAG: FGGY-family carbohydrate kinase [Saprospiraceae bacterium]